MIKYIRLKKMPSRSVSNGLLIVYEENNQKHFMTADIHYGQIKYKLPDTKIVGIYQQIRGFKDVKNNLSKD